MSLYNFYLYLFCSHNTNHSKPSNENHNIKQTDESTNDVGWTYRQNIQSPNIIPNDSVIFKQPNHHNGTNDGLAATGVYAGDNVLTNHRHEMLKHTEGAYNGNIIPTSSTSPISQPNQVSYTQKS